MPKTDYNISAGVTVIYYHHTNGDTAAGDDDVNRMPMNASPYSAADILWRRKIPDTVSDARFRNGYTRKIHPSRSWASGKR